jgi:dTDP-4-amino-4,6-dideoxygalactose transaminase
MNKIPFFGIDRQYANLRKEILDATDKVYSSGKVLDGMYTDLFEQYMKKSADRKYACAVGSCTQALIFSLRAATRTSTSMFNTRDKVLIPAQSFIASLNAILEAGYDPVFCDVDASTGLIDLNKIPVHHSEIAAVMYVNLFGNIIDYDKLTAYRQMWADDIPVIEDAAQSWGARYRGIPSGKLGTVSCLSFDPTKNLNNYGSGGMILTDDPEIWEMVNDMRDNGKGNEHIASGTNSKMSEADCAQMIIKLRYFKDWQLRRAEIAEYYTSELDGYVITPSVDMNVEHAWSKYVIHYEHRDYLQSFLSDSGIETKKNYPIPLHLHSLAFAFDIEYNTGVLEGAEQFSKSCLSLPIYPELTDSEVEAVVDAVKECIS